MLPTRSKLIWAIGLAVIAGLALLPRLEISRDIDPGQPQWIGRAAAFHAAVSRGAWSKTFLAPHPALPVLWIAGFAEAAANDPSFAARGLAASRAVGIASSLLLVLAAWAVVRIRRVTNDPAPLATALAAGLLLAFDPVLILTSGLIGLDGFYSTMFLLAALLLVLHGLTVSRGSLLGALTAAGLATATKGAGLALVLAPPLLRLGGERVGRRPGWARIAALMAGVALAGAVAVAILLPEVWVKPVYMVSRLLTGGAHENESLLVVMTRPSPNFLLGKVGEFRGPLFYLVNFAFRTTPLVLIGLLAGLLTAGFRRSRLVRQLTAISLLYLVLITLARQKEWRYLIPILAMADVIGAIGLVELSAAVASRARTAWPRALPLLLVVVQGAWVWSGRPYYELRLNPLAGGPKVAAHAIQLGWTGGYRETLDFLRRESKRLHRPITWSGGAFKWKYYGPRRAAGSRFRWLGRDPGNVNADCHVFYSLEDVFGRDATDQAWANRGVVAARVVRMGLEVVRIRCLPERGFLPESASTSSAAATGVP